MSNLMVVFDEDSGRRDSVQQVFRSTSRNIASGPKGLSLPLPNGKIRHAVPRVVLSALLSAKCSTVTCQPRASPRNFVHTCKSPIQAEIDLEAFPMDQAAIILGRRCPDRRAGCRSRKVDEDEAFCINVECYFIQTVLLHVEADCVLKLRSFDQLALAVILPAVILT